MLLILIPAAWLSISIIILALCTMAARGDEAMAAASQRVDGDPCHRGEGALGRGASCCRYRPRRASTWGTVRSRILMSDQSDQLATYR